LTDFDKIWHGDAIWRLTDLNVIRKVFCDYNLEIILIFAVLELWLIQL